MASRSIGIGIGIGIPIEGACICSVISRNSRNRFVEESSSGRWTISSSLSGGGGVPTRSRLKREWEGKFGGSSWRKMSNTEGLAKRIRDPQVASDVTTDAVKRTRNTVRSAVSHPGVKSLVVAVGIPLFLGIVDAFINSPSSQWYKDIKKPVWDPPGFIFGTAWSILYPVMGLASWLVWTEGGWQRQGRPLTLYIIQLALNLAWPALFFGAQNPLLALIDISVLIVAIGATIKAFQSVNHVAANLMKPYLAWVIFATALNFSIWSKNRGVSGAIPAHAE